MSLLLYLALSAGFAQEVKRDCLAGLCLGAPAQSSMPNTLTDIADHRWERRVKVCAGKVVEITIQTGWAAPSFTWNDIADGAVTHLNGELDFSAAVTLEKSIKTVMQEIGWVNYKESHSNPWAVFYMHPSLPDERKIMFAKSADNRGVALLVWTTHADATALCAPEFAHGL